MLESDIDFNTLLDGEDTTPSNPVNTIIPSNDFTFNDEESPWLWNGKPINEIDTKKHSCFVYLITNKVNGMRYVGFKNTLFKKTRTIKGKKKHGTVESDWRTYWSSSEILKNEVSFYGKGNYLREILYLCPLKGVGKYFELKEQIDREVLTKNSSLYYNGIVNVRLGINALKRWGDVVKADIILGDTTADTVLSKKNDALI